MVAMGENMDKHTRHSSYLRSSDLDLNSEFNLNVTDSYSFLSDWMNRDEFLDFDHKMSNNCSKV